MNTFKPQAELTVILRKTQAIEQCDGDVAAIKAGTSNIFRYDVSEPYFHQLRFHIESDPELAKKVSVSYVNEKEEILPITVTDSLRWPPNFLTECWDIEARIHKVRREKVQAGAEPDSRAEAATENTENQIALLAGSAETGGEKAAANPQLVIACLEEAIELFELDDEVNTPGTDSWLWKLKSEQALIAYAEAEASPNFPHSSQNQTVSSGVEGAHEGTTADKSESREPEKLNNAQRSYDCICGNGHNEECRSHNRALAESSLSSPPPVIPTSRGTTEEINRAKNQTLEDWDDVRTPTSRQSSSLSKSGAESVHPGKQNTADKSGTQLPKEK